jgi:hypothetical protein
MTTKKIYTDDPLVHYATTDLSIERTKMQIDGILAEYGVKKVGWNWDIPREASVFFEIVETVENVPIRLSVKVICPTLWAREKPRARPPRLEEIDWKVSLRAMYWYIKTHLETAYAMESSKTVAFLGFIQGADPNKRLKDYILPQLSKYAALEVVEKEKTNEFQLQRDSPRPST